MQKLDSQYGISFGQKKWLDGKVYDLKYKPKTQELEMVIDSIKDQSNESVTLLGRKGNSLNLSLFSLNEGLQPYGGSRLYEPEDVTIYQNKMYIYLPTLSEKGALTLPNPGSGGSYGGSSAIPGISKDWKQILVGAAMNERTSDLKELKQLKNLQDKVMKLQRQVDQQKREPKPVRFCGAYDKTVNYEMSSLVVFNDDLWIMWNPDCLVPDLHGYDSEEEYEQDERSQSNQRMITSGAKDVAAIYDISDFEAPAKGFIRFLPKEPIRENLVRKSNVFFATLSNTGKLNESLRQRKTCSIFFDKIIQDCEFVISSMNQPISNSITITEPGAYQVTICILFGKIDKLTTCLYLFDITDKIYNPERLDWSLAENKMIPWSQREKLGLHYIPTLHQYTFPLFLDFNESNRFAKNILVWQAGIYHKEILDASGTIVYGDSKSWLQITKL